MLRSLFLDFDSYFASVEQQLNPQWREKPLGVVAVMTDSSCCIAASYAAKQLGIKTGTNIGEAKRLCSDLILVEARHKKYVDMHHKAVALVDEIVPVRQVRSIDEMECELTGRWRSREHAERLAREVKAHLKKHLGDCMTVSIGVAQNTLLAKMASNLQKPNGLTVMAESDVPTLLYAKPVRFLHGVGRRMEERLIRYGLHTIGDVYAAPRGVLRNAWGGVEGSAMYDKLRGAWYEPRQRAKQSISHSHVLPPELRNAEGALGVLDLLTQKAAMRLRKEGYYAAHLTVYAKERAHGRRKTWEAAAGVGETQDTQYLLHTAHTLWRRVLQQQGQEGKASQHRAFSPHAVGLVLYGLVSAQQHNLDLFAEVDLERNVDSKVNSKLYFKAAPESIPSAVSEYPEYESVAERDNLGVDLTRDAVREAQRCTLLPLPVQKPSYRDSLLHTMDAINQQYGKNTLYFASAHTAREHAPMRIAFQRIPDALTE